MPKSDIARPILRSSQNSQHVNLFTAGRATATTGPAHTNLALPRGLPSIKVPPEKLVCTAGNTVSCPYSRPLRAFNPANPRLPVVLPGGQVAPGQGGGY